MSSGTEIITASLQKIGVYSPVSPANPESIVTGKDALNSMIAQWQDDGIDMSCVPLKQPGSELSEPLGSRNAIIDNLAIELSSYFPAANVSNELIKSAKKGLNFIKRRWKEVTIPYPKASGTLPIGQGNKAYLRSNPFFAEGTEIGDSTDS